jgi:predicted Fe-S protein YdhL (DUF1289 family)
MESPCIKVCVMDPEDRYCLGCKRTLREIARWGEMREEERIAIMAELAARKNASDIAEVPPAPLA